MFKVYRDEHGRESIAVVCYICEEPIPQTQGLWWLPNGTSKVEAFFLCEDQSCHSTMEVLAPAESWKALRLSYALSYGYENSKGYETLRKIK